MVSSSEKDYPFLQNLSEEILDENISLKQMLYLIESNKSVLEFGCATGYFSHLLMKKGCEVVGIEINPDAARLAEQYCKQVIVADLDSIFLPELLPSQEFDIAVFGDVLEHLRNPWKVLEETRRLLKPDGYIVASIPNIAHGAIRLALLKGKFEYTNLGILDDTHLRFFTRSTVQDLFEKSGYEVDLIGRTTLPIFANSDLVPQMSRNDFPLEIIQQIEKDEDADTLQFIVRAFPSTLEGRYNALDNRYKKSLAEIEDLQSKLKSIQIELAKTEEELHQSIELTKTKEELHQSKDTILFMQSSKFWKLRTKWINFKKILGIH